MRNGQKKDVAELVKRKDVAELVKNKDFFEFKDGIYYTIEALCSKYECQHTHIYRRRKEFDIPQLQVLGVTVIKDDNRFEKLSKANNFQDHQVSRLSNYAVLHRTVEEAVTEMKETNKLHNDWNAVHNQEISRLTYEVNENSKLLRDILNHLTKEKTDGVNSQKE